MKPWILIAGLLLGFVGYGRTQVQFEYENKDNKSYTFKMRIGEKRTAYTFESSTKKVVVMETMESLLFLASKCPEVSVKTGTRIKIEDGCLSVEEK
jgi:hypothetical protein